MYTVLQQQFILSVFEDSISLVKKAVLLICIASFLKSYYFYMFVCIVL